LLLLSLLHWLVFIYNHYRQPSNDTKLQIAFLEILRAIFFGFCAIVEELFWGKTCRRISKTKSCS